MGGLDNDKLFGEDGKNTLGGNQGDDILHGGEGHDVLYGRGGNDQLFGDLGNDTLAGHFGSDELDGGGTWGEDNDSCYDDDITVFYNCEMFIITEHRGIPPPTDPAASFEWESPVQ
jgi:Ca2+-binding RTX toxin-like protein